MKIDAILIKANDNVATAICEIEPGQTVNVSRDQAQFEVKAREKIQFGHKFAVLDIDAGQDVLKYGEVIGRATQLILAGSHAHIHNIESLRGRGDLVEKETSL